MATMHDLVVRALNLEARRKLDWLPEIPEGTGEDGCTRFTDDALRRKLLRLMANSAVEVLRLRVNEDYYYYSEFRDGLQKIRRMNSRSAAASATSRLLRLYQYAVDEFGENAGSDFNSAAELSNLLLNSYNSWSERETYDDAAAHYSTVAGSAEMSPTRQKLVTSMLAELKALESK